MNRDQAEAKRTAADEAAPELQRQCIAARHAYMDTPCDGDATPKAALLRAWETAEVNYRVNERDRRAVSGDQLGMARRTGLCWESLGWHTGCDDAHRALVSTARHGGVAVLSMSELESHAHDGALGGTHPGWDYDLRDEAHAWSDGYIAGYLSLVSSHECALPWSAYDDTVSSATGAALEMTAHALGYFDAWTPNREAHARRLFDADTDERTAA